MALISEKPVIWGRQQEEGEMGWGKRHTHTHPFVNCCLSLFSPFSSHILSTQASQDQACSWLRQLQVTWQWGERVASIILRKGSVKYL